MTGRRLIALVPDSDGQHVWATWSDDEAAYELVWSVGESKPRRVFVGNRPCHRHERVTHTEALALRKVFVENQR